MGESHIMKPGIADRKLDLGDLQIIPAAVAAQHHNEEDVAPLELCNLPDEIILKIVSKLEIEKYEDVRALKALGLTCRKMRAMTNDRKTIKAMLHTAEMDHYFPSQVWDHNLLFRLSKYAAQVNECFHTIWPLWLKARHPRRHQSLPIDNSDVFMKGLIAIMRIDGLQDNCPNHWKLPTSSDADKMCMFAAALIYQEVFLSRFFVILPGNSIALALMLSRAALRYTLLVKGPLVATRVLFNSAQIQTNETRKWLTFDSISTRIRRGQSLHILKPRGAREHVQTLWTLGNVIAYDFSRPHGPSRPPLPQIPVSDFVERAVQHIITSWVMGGKAANFFGEESGSEDLQKCLEQWENGTDLL